MAQNGDKNSEPLSDTNNSYEDLLKEDSNKDQMEKNSQNIAIGRKISIKSQQNVNCIKNSNKNDKSQHWVVCNEGIQSKARNPSAIERSNFVSLMKLIVKELIESSAKTGRNVDSNSIPLNHLFVLLEQIFKHGMKSKKSLLTSKKELWNVFELVERLSSDASDITSSARELPNIKTPLGRARAWLRLALMKKKLSDYFRILLDNREVLLTDFYVENALMMSDEAIVIGGLLVGLNILDCNLCVKEEDLDFYHSVIDFSFYLKDNIQPNSLEPDWEQNDSVDNCNSSNDTISVVLDQKNYIEELNRHLSSTISNLENKIESLQTDNILMTEELQTLRQSKKFKKVRAHSETSDANAKDNENHIKTVTIETNEEIILIEEQLDQELKRRQKAEKELEVQVFLKKEAETAMHLLERDVLEKQDTIITLRRQLEDIKTINLQMYNKLQECEIAMKNKTNHISHLEQNVSVMANTISQLEAKVTYYEKQRLNVEENNQKLNEQLSDIERKRLSSEKDALTEKEWRTTLQKLIDEQQEHITAMQTELETLKCTASEAIKMKRDYAILENKNREYELSLEQIGKQLHDSKLEVDSLRENSGRLREAVWTSDKGAIHCHQCNKTFSVARRRHHCRSCGEIFCSNCSNNEMPLPSNKKPVRVCDSCHAFLLERYSAT